MPVFCLDMEDVILLHKSPAPDSFNQIKDRTWTWYGSGWGVTTHKGDVLT